MTEEIINGKLHFCAVSVKTESKPYAGEVGGKELPEQYFALFYVID